MSVPMEETKETSQETSLEEVQLSLQQLRIGFEREQNHQMLSVIDHIEKQLRNNKNWMLAVNTYLEKYVYSAQYDNARNELIDMLTAELVAVVKAMRTNPNCIMQ